MPRTSSARERILKAAFELISDRGYLGASTREIAQKAGVAEVTVFRQFANKETLFAEVLRSFSSMPVMAELVPQLKLLPYEAALEMLFVRFIERLEANRGWIRVLNNEVAFAPETMQRVYGSFLERLFRVFTDFFRDAQERGVIRKELNPEYVARAFHSLVFGFFHIEGTLGITSDLVPMRREMISTFVDTFCRGTRAPD